MKKTLLIKIKLDKVDIYSMGAILELGLGYKKESPFLCENAYEVKF